MIIVRLLNSGEYQEVTVMFADVPNFYNIIVSCEPQQIMQLLNELFVKLDRLVEKHSVSFLNFFITI